MSEMYILQGTFLSIFGVGTLIQGRPGIGKSELALGLLDRKHSLIADDAPYFSIVENQLYGENLLDKAFLTIRGLGLIDVERIVGPSSHIKRYPLHLIINLQEGPLTNPYSDLEGEEIVKDIFGCLIPCVTIPIIKPRNLEVLVETIVKNYLIKISKEDLPVDKFQELLRRRMEITTP